MIPVESTIVQGTFTLENRSIASLLSLLMFCPVVNENAYSSVDQGSLTIKASIYASGRKYDSYTLGFLYAL